MNADDIQNPLGINQVIKRSFQDNERLDGFSELLAMLHDDNVEIHSGVQFSDSLNADIAVAQLVSQGMFTGVHHEVSETENGVALSQPILPLPPKTMSQHLIAAQEESHSEPEDFHSPYPSSIAHYDPTSLSHSNTCDLAIRPVQEIPNTIKVGHRKVRAESSRDARGTPQSLQPTNVRGRRRNRSTITAGKNSDTSSKKTKSVPSVTPSLERLENHDWWPQLAELLITSPGSSVPLLDLKHRVDIVTRKKRRSGVIAAILRDVYRLQCDPQNICTTCGKIANKKNCSAVCSKNRKKVTVIKDVAFRKAGSMLTL